MDGKLSALNGLGSKPFAPIRPERTVEDATVEGLVKSWTDCHGARGLFTAEGATVLAGHSMSDDNRLKTAAALSKLWDDGRVDRVRAGDGFLSLTGRRLSAHIMLQPGVARRLLEARDLADQGLTGRFLICGAPEQAGSRFFRAPPSSERDSRFLAYRAAAVGLLRRPVPASDGRNELRPRPLPFTSDAARIWRDLHDHVEAKLGIEGELGGVKPFGNKLAEHAARIAGVLTLFADLEAAAVEAGTMDRVRHLADYYAAEAVRLSAESQVSERIGRAERLRGWLVDQWGAPLVSVQDVMQRGPRAVREKAKADLAVADLVEHGWLIEVGPGTVAGVSRKATFRIVRAERRRP